MDFEVRRVVSNVSTWVHTDAPFAGLGYQSEEQIHSLDGLEYEHNPCARREGARQVQLRPKRISMGVPQA